MTTPAPTGTDRHFRVSVACEFDADDGVDALRQMIAWLDDYAWHAGYRLIEVDDLGNEVASIFLDADEVLS